MACELCGKEGKMFYASVEGSRLMVCEVCGRYGKILGPVRESTQVQSKGFTSNRKEVIQLITDNFSSLIKNKREQRGLKQEDFAQKINEKVSIIHKIETGSYTPSIKLARKIEKFLGIKLIENSEGAAVNLDHKEADPFTLGHFIKKK